MQLILIPGLICTDALWAPQIAALSDIAEITVADHRRHDAIADIAAALLQSAPPRFALAGLSMGGYVALEVMGQAPHRVTNLALLDTSARADDPAKQAERRALIDQAGMGRFRGVSDRLLPLFVHPERLKDKALGDIVYRMAEETGRDAFIRQQRAILSRPDYRAGLAAIAAPTLVLCGRQDRLTPLHLHEEMAAAIPDADLAVVETCGHLSTLERPDAVNQAMRRWLTT